MDQQREMQQDAGDAAEDAGDVVIFVRPNGCSRKKDLPASANRIVVSSFYQAQLEISRIRKEKFVGRIHTVSSD